MSGSGRFSLLAGGTPMLGNTTAILVSDGGEPFEKVELALQSQGIKTYRARSTAELPVLLEQAESPQMIFTDTTFPDGTWADALSLVARHFVPVIVVSRRVDLE